MSLELNKSLLLDAVKNLGYKYTIENFDRLAITKDAKTIRFLSVIPDVLPEYDRRVADDKLLSRVLLRKAGVKNIVRDYNINHETLPNAIRALADSPCSHYVVKPRYGARGIGVTMNVAKNFAAVKHAMQKLHNQQLSPVMVEEQVAGRDFRFFVVGKKSPRLVAVLERVPAHVIGDGTLSIRQLIQKTNEQRLANKYTKDKPIKVLHKIDANRIPEAGEHVALAQTANMSTGGYSIQIPVETISPEIQWQVFQTHTTIGLPYSGIDVLAQDLSEPSTAYINEVNAVPDFGMHHFPCEGQPIPVAEHTIRSLFEDL